MKQFPSTLKDIEGIFFSKSTVFRKGQWRIGKGVETMCREMRRRNKTRGRESERGARRKVNPKMGQKRKKRI